MLNFLIFTIILFATTMLILAFFKLYSEGYKDGQIDALGKKNIDYCLKEHQDGSKTWEKV